MKNNYLSNIELYYTSSEFIESDRLILTGDELHHSVNVMRNTVGSTIFVTDGKGSIFTSKITSISVNHLSANIIERREYENKANKIWFCIPILKNPDRLKFAFEKCVELGITNFVLFSSNYSISKNVNSEKFQKVTLAAMKQSLRAFLPQILSSNFDDIINFDGGKILFDQNAETIFDGNQNINQPTYYLFGPEGGFDKTELESVPQENRFSLTENRLRSETAIIKCASVIKLPQ